MIYTQEKKKSIKTHAAMTQSLEGTEDGRAAVTTAKDSEEMVAGLGEQMGSLHRERNLQERIKWTLQK